MAGLRYRVLHYRNLLLQTNTSTSSSRAPVSETSTKQQYIGACMDGCFVDGCFVGGWMGAYTVGWVGTLVVLSPPPSEPASASRGASLPRAAAPKVSTKLQTLGTCVARLDALWLAKVCGWVGGCVVGWVGLWVGGFGRFVGGWGVLWVG